MSRRNDTIQLTFVLEEIQTLLSSLSHEDNVHPSLRRYVRPLVIKLEMAERMMVDDGGTFTITVGDGRSDPVPYDASEKTVQDAFNQARQRNAEASS